MLHTTRFFPVYCGVSYAHAYDAKKGVKGGKNILSSSLVKTFKSHLRAGFMAPSRAALLMKHFTTPLLYHLAFPLPFFLFGLLIVSIQHEHDFSLQLCKHPLYYMNKVPYSFLCVKWVWVKNSKTISKLITVCSKVKKKENNNSAKDTAPVKAKVDLTSLQLIQIYTWEKGRSLSKIRCNLANCQTTKQA